MTGRDPAPATLGELTRSAMADMSWLMPSDAALRALALRLATAIDANGTDPDALAKLAPRFQSVLQDLGGTPAARRALSVDEPDEDLVTELRAA